MESTVVITVASCRDNFCKVVPITTGVILVSDEMSVYITFCPLITSQSEKFSLLFPVM